jgi:hypothetical protein
MLTFGKMHGCDLTTAHQPKVGHLPDDGQISAG